MRSASVAVFSKLSGSLPILSSAGCGWSLQAPVEMARGIDVVSPLLAMVTGNAVNQAGAHLMPMNQSEKHQHQADTDRRGTAVVAAEGLRLS